VDKIFEQSSMVDIIQCYCELNVTRMEYRRNDGRR